MKQVLILGGTSFFGKLVAEKLSKKGFAVTVASRNKPGFVNPENHLNWEPFDRKSSDSLKKLVSKETWDVVLDQICFSPFDAKNLLDSLQGGGTRCVVTSSAYVYEKEGKDIKEEAFEPIGNEYSENLDRPELSYEEGKRQAESLLFQKKERMVSCARFPIVLGSNDPTKRFQNHVEAIRNKTRIHHPSRDSKASFISDIDASNALIYLIENPHEGAFNFKSGDITFEEIISSMAKGLNTDSESVLSSESETFNSTYSFQSEWTLSIEKALNIGWEPVSDLRSFITEASANLN